MSPLFVKTICSDTREGQVAQDEIMELVEAEGFPMQDQFGIRLALEEAIVNAIKHGNKMDPTKKVQICVEITEESLNVVIEDEGAGFRPEDVPDPTAEENLEKPSGRGLMLMNAFMNVMYEGCGNRVVMRKSRVAEVE
ncbi:MAG: ATP-binding protein [Planctomycetaceae bacterium]